MAGQQSRESPWSVRGVTHEARTAAIKAARRGGVSLGVWLSRAVMGAAIANIKAPPPGPTLEQTLARLVETMEQQRQQDAARLAALEAMAAATAREQREEAAALRARLDAADAEAARRRGLFARIFGGK